MTINTSIPQVCFSSALPDVINVTTSGATAVVQVAVIVDNTTAWTTELYAVNNHIYLYDVREIIEEQIRTANNAHAVCTINFTEGNTTQYIQDITVVIANFEKANADTWLAGHFLTTRTEQRIDRNGKQKLYWLLPVAETMAYSIIATVRNSSGNLVDVTWTQQSSTSVAAGIYSYTVDVPTIETHFALNGTLLAFTVQRGNRAMKFFVTDEPPQERFLFMNNFNCEEFYALYGTTIEKQKMESAEALYLRNKIQYDFDLQQEFEVESSLLNREEAEWLQQLITSRYVAKLMPDNTYKQILPEGESEVSDSLAAEHRFKFTYKFARL